MSDMSQEEAKAGVEQRIQATTAAVFPTKAELEPQRLGQRPCGPTFDAENIAIEHRYYIRGVPPQENVEMIRDTQSYWVDQGYEVSAERHSGTGRFVGVSVHDSDGFRLAIARNTQEELYITGASPCLPPDVE